MKYWYQYLVLLSLSLLLVLSACNSLVEVISITVNPPTGIIKVGEKLTITAVVTVKGSDKDKILANIKEVIWVNGDRTVAELSDINEAITEALNKGERATITAEILGKKAGEATITATYKANRNAKASIEVTVLDNREVSSVVVAPSNGNIKIGENLQLTATVTGNNLDNSDKGVTWSIVDSTVASINSQGVVTGIAEGQTTVTATSDFDNTKSGTAAIIVSSNKNVTSVVVAPVNTAIKIGASQAFTATVNGLNLDLADKGVTWSVGNSSIVAIDVNGVVTGIAEGQTTVTATSDFDNTKSDTATIVVNSNKSVTSVSVTPTNAAIKVGGTQALTATVNGTNLDLADKAVTWTVTDTSIAKVDTNGVVTGLAEGETTVTAVSNFDSTKSATVTIIVNSNKSVTSVNVTPTNAAIKVGDTQTFTATVNGINLDPADKAVTWTVGNSSIVQVDTNGVVTGLTEGETTVTATSDFDNTKSGTATIKVNSNKSVTSVTVVPTSTTVIIGGTQIFTATINGTNLDPADKTVTWSVTNTNIATVDASGVVTGVAEGETTVTAISNFDNTKSGTATIKVNSNKSVTSVTVVPTSTTVIIGGTQAFTATVNGTNLDPADKTVTWSVTNTNIATVDASGVVTGVAEGETTIIATSDFDTTKSGTATIKVNSNKNVTSVTVTPTSATVIIGGTQAFTATVNGISLDPTDKTVTWSVADTSIATVNASGVVTGVAEGETTVTATSNFDNTKSGTAIIKVNSNKSVTNMTVVPTNATVIIGSTQAFTATVNGTNLDPTDKTVTWSVADTSIATVDASGVVTGVAEGETTVTATSDFDNTKSGIATIKVNSNKSVTNVTVVPTNATVIIGSTQAFTATVNGTNLDPADKTVTWSVADTSIAIVDISGVVIGVAEGETTVTATSDFDNTKSGTATIVVNSNSDKSVTSVSVTPTSATVIIGGTQAFTATVNGTNLDPTDKTVTWSVADTSIATVNASGVVTGIAVGETTVTATSDFDNTKSGTATIKVNSNKSVTSVTVTPTSATVIIGGTQAYTATVNGTNLDPADKTVTWSVADTSIATVDASGVVTGVAEGETTVTATSDFDSTKSGTATIKVNSNKSVTSVSVTPTSATVIIGGTQTYTAIVNGTNLDPADKTVTWSVADTSIATVNASGVVTGIAVGETTVTATSDFDNTKSGTATIKVNSNKSVTSVTVTPDGSAFPVGGTQALTAIVDGTNLDPADKTVTWSVADTSIATVNANGVVTGLDHGQTTVTATSDFDNTKSDTVVVFVGG